MGAFQWSHVGKLPSLLSLARLPLAAAFALVDDPVTWLAILVLAGVTDVADGWYARHHHLVTATGAVIDPITDKTFVLTVVITLIVRQVLPLWAVLALSTREIGELPLVVWLAVSRSARKGKAERASANVPGKIVTLLQFATVTCALFACRLMPPTAIVTAIAGVVAAVSYWRQLLRTNHG